jgi:hypothetical protein
MVLELSSLIMGLMIGLFLSVLLYSFRIFIFIERQLKRIKDIILDKFSDKVIYDNTLLKQKDGSYLAKPLINDGNLIVDSWRYSYNLRGIIRMENSLNPKKTALLVVHPLAIDDGSGLITPNPNGAIHFGTSKKNKVANDVIKKVTNPFLNQYRGKVSKICIDLQGREDGLRNKTYPSISNKGKIINKTSKILLRNITKNKFKGNSIEKKLLLNKNFILTDYFKKFPSLNAGSRYNGGFEKISFPVNQNLEVCEDDIVFYDGDGWNKSLKYLKMIGVKHILAIGFSMDVCLRRRIDYLKKHFNIIIVSDASLATFPGPNNPNSIMEFKSYDQSLDYFITSTTRIRMEKNK